MHHHPVVLAISDHRVDRRLAQPPVRQLQPKHPRPGHDGGRRAEAARETARRRLRDQITEARSLQDGGQLAGQLELLLRRVEELREGAFSPYSQQPVVRAMLLPLGSLGGTALLEYLLVPGFG